MANDKTINLRIKVAPTADSKKALDNLNKISTNWDRVFGPNGDKPVKNQKREIDTLSKAWANLGKEIKLAKENFEGGFAAGAKSLSGLKSFTGFVEGATKKVFNLKNAIAATAIGAGAIWLGKSIFEEGAQQIKTRKRVQREFGTYGGNILTSNAQRINFAAGIQDDEAARGLIPLAEQLEAIQEGAQFRGMKRPLSVMQADTLKRRNLAFGADIFKRVATLAPDVEPEELGRVLGDALAGPEGVRSLISTLNLSKRSRSLSQANEKGQAFKVLSPEERKKYGISKAGQFLEQGDLVNLLLERSGMTDKAAADEQKTFSHQIKQIKSTLMDQIGDIGSGAIDSLTLKLGQGATAAERLRNYLASDEGKKTVDGIKDSVVRITEGIASIVADVPKIGAWLKEHKTLLEVLAGAYGVAKIAPTAVGLARGIGAVGAGASTLGGALKGLTESNPLYVKQVAGVAGAALAGYELGTYLDKKLGLSTKIANALTPGETAKEEAGVQKNRQFLADQAANREKAIQTLEARGLSRGQAIYQADHPIEITNNTNLVADGHTLAKITEKHLIKSIQNRTANGASPASRQ